MLTDSQVKLLQTIIFHWILDKGAIDFYKARKAVEDAAVSIGLEKDSLPKRMEYQIIYPLYQVGILEYGMTEKGAMLFPCFSSVVPSDSDGYWYFDQKSTEPRYQFDTRSEIVNASTPEKYFKSIPAFNGVVNGWRKQQVTNLQYLYDFTRYSFVYREEVKHDGIYKHKDVAWIDSYLRYNGSLHLMPRYSENPEAFRIAKSVILASQGVKMFEYSGQKLTCLRYFDMPVPIIRGLILANPHLLEHEELYRFEYVMEFDKIETGIVKQLERIFSVSILKRGIHD